MILVGDCVMLTGGIFKWSYWTVIAVNDDGTFDLKDKEDTLPSVRGSWVAKANRGYCKDN